jgi:hypothetical protein
LHCADREELGSVCRGRLFGRERPKIIPDFQIHPVNVGEETRCGHAIVFAVGFRFANLRHLPFELTSPAAMKPATPHPLSLSPTEAERDFCGCGFNSICSFALANCDVLSFIKREMANGG